MQSKNYTIKKASRREMDIAIAWAAEEGWNPGLQDGDCYYAADPQGFLIGFLGTDPVATISAVRYSNTFGFLGFYIVKPEYRGQGYGLQICNAGIQYLSLMCLSAGFLESPLLKSAERFWRHAMDTTLP